MTADKAPYEAVIRLNIWSWERPRAAAILEQLVDALVRARTDDQSAVTIHHHVYSVLLREKP
jgi:hypothetical protein